MTGVEGSTQRHQGSQEQIMQRMLQEASGAGMSFDCPIMGAQSAPGGTGSVRFHPPPLLFQLPDPYRMATPDQFNPLRNIGALVNPGRNVGWRSDGKHLNKHHRQDPQVP